MVKLAYISVGSNLGDKLTNCTEGIFGIEKNGNSSVMCRSNFYLTSPTDYLSQDWFVNALVKIQTVLTPQDLLNELVLIQNMLGRKNNTFRFGPRKLDLDIIFYEDKVIRCPHLSIPHPRMHKRLFVLKPMCDIDPDFVHPVFKITVGSILKNIPDVQQTIIQIDDPLGNS